MVLKKRLSSSLSKVVGGISALLVCCAFVGLLTAGLFLYQAYQQVLDGCSSLDVDAPESSVTVPEIERPAIDSISTETLETLKNTRVPKLDPYDVACRLQSLCDIQTTLPAREYKLGNQEKFWVYSYSTHDYTQITATLLYITPHSYFWAEDGVQVDQNETKVLMDTFEKQVYPKDREHFGSEWTPGVDCDEHIFVLYSSTMGEGASGYFNPIDSFNPTVEKYSNGHEIFMLSGIRDLGDEYMYTVLAHELVHMIQFHVDWNEEDWMKEGAAGLGAFLNGYDVLWDFSYVDEPDQPLTEIGAPNTHRRSLVYGQSFLYLTYFLDRYGQDATKALHTNSKNGLSGVDDTLAALNIIDPQTGKIVTADDVFMDWAAALYLKDESIGYGLFTYHNYPDAPQTSETEIIGDCPSSILDRSVYQYGIDYLKINCTGDHTLKFSGLTSVGLLSVDAYSGKYAFWSNKGYQSDMTLTRKFDLTGVSGPIKLSYQTSYNLGSGSDSLCYLEASTDGKTWDILETPSGTGYNSYSWGYTGASNGWILEQVDLSQFAGQKVQIRFEYITRAIVDGEGFLLDDIRLDAINYQTDFEKDDGGWEANGFVRIQNILPQTYRLSLILKGDTTTVTNIPLNADQTAEVPLSLKEGEAAILIVTGTTRFTKFPAAYQIEVR